MHAIINLITLFELCQCLTINFNGQPRNIHLSYGNSVNEFWVTWSTTNDTLDSIVNFGSGVLNSTSHGSSTKFVAPGPENRTQFIHRVKLDDLKYVYRTGGRWGWSPLFYFTVPTKDSYRPTFAVYGDMGVANARALHLLQTGVLNKQFDLVLHNGDFGYDMVDNNGKQGDDFLEMIQPIAGYVPYDQMTAPGNHEAYFNFTNYVNSFTMPGNTANHYYSMDIGLVRLIAFSTEFYFFTQFGTSQIKRQRDWLENELKLVNGRRNITPWIVTMAHRPMYCSNLSPDDCTTVNSTIRAALEKLFYDQKVDLEIWSHEHNFERLWPVYNRTIFNGSQFPYTDPAAPVHIITGSAGCKETSGPFGPFLHSWSAFRSLDYGYSLVKAYNQTHMNIKYMSENRNGTVTDEIWLIKNHHGSFERNSHLHKGRYIDIPTFRPNAGVKRTNDISPTLTPLSYTCGTPNVFPLPNLFFLCSAAHIYDQL